MRFTCPATEQVFDVDDELAGKPFRCPACSEMHTAPALPGDGAPLEEERPETTAGEPAAPEPDIAAFRPGSNRLAKVLLPVCLIVAVGGTALVAYLLYWSLGIPRKAGRHLESARSSYEAGRFREALDEALEAEAVLDENPSSFDQATTVSHREEIEMFKAAAATYDEAQATARGAADDFQGAVSSLDTLIERQRQQAHGEDALYASLRSMRGSTIAEEAGRVVEKGGDPTDVLERVAELRALLPSGAESEGLGSLEEKAAAFVNAERTKLRAEADGVFRQVLTRLKRREFLQAHQLLELHHGRLARLPREIGASVAEEYRAEVRLLAKAGFGDGPDLAAAEIAAVERFLELEEVLNEAQLAAGTALARPEAAAAELKALRTKAQGLREALGQLSALAVEKLDACLREVREIDKFRQEWRRKASQGDLAAFVVANGIDAARGSPRIRFRKAGVRTDALGAAVEFTVDGARVTLSAPRKSFEKNIYLAARGYRFRIPWTRRICTYLLQAADLARRMEEAGVSTMRFAEWRVVDGPSFPMAMGDEGWYFLHGVLSRAEEPGKESMLAVEELKAAAQELRDGMRDDETIPLEVRQALVPVIESSYGKTDPRDLLDPGFCRRAIAEGYLEEHVPGVGERHARPLARYRKAVETLGLAFPVLTLRPGTGVTYTALRPVDLELVRLESTTDAPAEDEHVHFWRKTDARAGTTDFIVPPSRNALYSFYHRSTYSGLHDRPPEDAPPLRVAMVHPAVGTVASFDLASKEFCAETERWNEAAAVDLSLLDNAAWGGPGWGFPPHVPVFDARGTVSLLATRRGPLESPDFEIEDAAARRSAQDEYIDKCARLLASPGELGLFFRYFIRYCLDSPIPSMPGLLGNHSAQGEMHQTVFEFLDRKMAGAFVGDCDDVAEFFQVVTRRQGKLSHIFSLPQHAACGFVERRETEAGEAEGRKAAPYALIFLQTGPTIIFEGDSLDEVVENGIEFFSGDERAHYTVASVPFLFRFAGEKTRTPYWLSDRILVDEPYAELLIRVQSYWHYHYYATGIRVMEELLKTDKDISNFTELAGLYRRVHLFKQAIEMTRAGLAVMKRKDEKVRLNETKDIASFHHRLKQDEKASLVLEEIRAATKADIKAGRFSDLVRLMPVRLEAAGLCVAMERPFEAFDLIETDIGISLRAQGKLIDPVREAALAVSVAIRDLEDKGKSLNGREKAVRDGLLNMLKADFTSKVFEDGDSFNDLIRNYSLLGSLAVAIEGREAVRRKLLEEGPYAAVGKKHVRRGREITEDDWAWIRICAPAYWRLIANLTDPEKPDDYDPETALLLVEAMLRGTDAGRKLGSMNMTRAAVFSGRIVRAAYRNDIEDFGHILAEVREIASDRLTDAVANEIGRRAGLVPLDEFPNWMDVFREYVGDKQHYFEVAHVALANDHYEHALAAAERITGYFPGEKHMADEAAYMKGLAERLKEQAAETERLRALRDEWEPLHEKMVSLAKADSPAEAAQAGDAALEIALKLGEDDPAPVTTLKELARLQAARGEYDESLKHCERFAALWEKQVRLDPGAIGFFEEMAKAFTAAKRIRGAEKLRTSIMGMTSTLYGDESPKMAVALYNTAEFYDGAGASAPAAALLQKALEIDEKAYGSEHPEVALDAGRLADVFLDLRRPADAEALYRRAAAILTKAKGPDHAEVAENLRGLARAQKHLQKFDEAEASLKRACAIDAKAHGSESEAVADALAELAELFDARGDLEQAEAHYARAARINEKISGAEHERTQESFRALAEILWRRDKLDEAEKHYRRVLAVDEKTHGPEHESVGGDLRDLADLASGRGEHAEAAALLERALGIFEHQPGPESVEAARVLNELGLSYAALKRHEEAEAAHKRALVLFAKALGEESYEVAIVLNNLGHLYGEMERYDDAERSYRRSLEIKAKVLEPDDLSVAASLTGLADILSARENYAEAEGLHARALRMAEKALGADSPRLVPNMYDLVNVLESQTKHAEAEKLLRRLLVIVEKAYGPAHKSTAACLFRLAKVLGAQGRQGEAEGLFRRVLAIDEKAYGPEHHEVAYDLGALATCLEDQWRHDEAGRCRERAVAILEKVRGPDHVDVAEALLVLGKLRRGRSEYADAESLFGRALAIDEKARGAEHPSLWRELYPLAATWQDMGRFGDAETALKRMLAIEEKAYGPEHPTLAATHHELGTLYRKQARYDEAEKAFQRAQALLEKAPGTESPAYADGLRFLARLRRNQGRYAQARSLLEQALAIHTGVLGEDDPSVATDLRALAHVDSSTGLFSACEAKRLRALAIDEKAYGQEHPTVALDLVSLSWAKRRLDKYAEAESMAKRALAIRTKRFGAESEAAAYSLYGLGVICEERGAFEEAEAHFRRSLAIVEKVYGAEHDEVADGLYALGRLHRDYGRLDEAEPLLERALVIYETFHGPEHPEVARCLRGLATLHVEQRRYAEAERVCRRAMEIAEKVGGVEHPNLVRALHGLVEVYKDWGKLRKAEPLYRRALAVTEKNAATMMPLHERTLGLGAEIRLRRRRYAEAEELARRSLALTERRLGPDHTEVAERLVLLAEVLRDAKRYAQAEPLYERAISIRRKVQAPTHPKLIKALESRAALLRRAGRAAEAVK